MQAGPGLPDEASNANQPKGQVPGGAGGDFAAGIGGSVPFNHLWPVVAGGGGMKDEALKLALDALKSAAAELYRASSYCNTYEVIGNTNDAITAIQKAFAAQPAVPDALTSADIQEHIEYVAGWNDCRQAMLKGMK
jgi:hypothetical protein